MTKQLKFSLSLLLAVIFFCPSCGNSQNNNNTVVQSGSGERSQQPPVAGPAASAKPKMQIVFLLDATGSMAGLIDAAKEKIWAIAGSLTQTEPAPEIEMGMIFYRDRGDEFITKRIPLGTEMDDLYEQLMAMQAMGGGDMPESVNQALYEGVTKMQWDTLSNTYRAIFLVGDCPPHMDYNDDVKYPVSCKMAGEKRIVINTILMGNSREAEQVWKQIAQQTNGEFIRTDMNVNNISIKTPYDKQISDLQNKLDNTRLYHGVSKELTKRKKTQSEKIKAEDASVNARRAEYSLSKSGKESYYGSNELVNDVINGKKLADIPVGDLPENMQKMSESQRRVYIENMIAERKSLEEEITRLNKQRQQYIDNEMAKIDKDKVENSFDDVIFNAVKTQAEEKSIKIEGKVKR